MVDADLIIPNGKELGEKGCMAFINKYFKKRGAGRPKGCNNLPQLDRETIVFDLEYWGKKKGGKKAGAKYLHENNPKYKERFTTPRCLVKEYDRIAKETLGGAMSAKWFKHD